MHDPGPYLSIEGGSKPSHFEKAVQALHLLCLLLRTMNLYSTLKLQTSWSLMFYYHCELEELKEVCFLLQFQHSVSGYFIS